MLTIGLLVFTCLFIYYSNQCDELLSFLYQAQKINNKLIEGNVYLINVDYTIFSKFIDNNIIVRSINRYSRDYFRLDYFNHSKIEYAQLKPIYQSTVTKDMLYLLQQRYADFVKAEKDDEAHIITKSLSINQNDKYFIVGRCINGVINTNIIVHQGDFNTYLDQVKQQHYNFYIITLLLIFISMMLLIYDFLMLYIQLI